jgi:hypothetical protein
MKAQAEPEDSVGLILIPSSFTPRPSALDLRMASFYQRNKCRVLENQLNVGQPHSYNRFGQDAALPHDEVASRRAAFRNSLTTTPMCFLEP